MALLTVEGLAYSYSGDMGHAVFREVTFSVSPGEVFCLLGPNGTGKSTLLKCISNVLQGWTGSVLLNDRAIHEMSPAAAARVIGYVPQNQVSSFPFRVKDIVVMGRAPHLNVFSSPGDKDLSVAITAMETVGILPLAERPCTTLSGGEWQLTLIARALAQQPKIMVLDEPTSHLDMGNQMKILGVVDALARDGMAVIMASHFPDHAFLVGNDVAILNHGRMRVKGKPDDVLNDATMRETYGIDVRVMYVKEGVGRKACFPLLPATGGKAVGPDR